MNFVVFGGVFVLMFVLLFLCDLFVGFVGLVILLLIFDCGWLKVKFGVDVV